MISAHTLIDSIRLWKGNYMMTDNTFLPSDTGDALQEVKDALYQRLADARQAAEVKFPLADEFELGINCRLDNEILWLESLLDKIERS
jgi:hypothetical protein